MNWFHRHCWSKWEKIPITMIGWDGETWTEQHQERRCETCGKYQRKEMS